MLKFYIPGCDRARNEQKITSSRAALGKLPFTLVTVGKKITTQPTRCIHISFRGKDREACFTSTIQFILRRGYSSNSVYRGKCNGVKPWNNLQFREARTTRKYKGLFNNAAVLYLTNPCNVYIFLNTHIFLFLDKNLKINLNRVFVRELRKDSCRSILNRWIKKRSSSLLIFSY